MVQNRNGPLGAADDEREDAIAVEWVRVREPLLVESPQRFVRKHVVGDDHLRRRADKSQQQRTADAGAILASGAGKQDAPAKPARGGLEAATVSLRHDTNSEPSRALAVPNRER